MESFIDYYAILGVPPDASTEDIKKAFRAGALKFHPDRNKSPDATARFIKLQKAYNVLNDPVERVKYDKRYMLHMQKEADTDSVIRPSGLWAETVSNVSPKAKRDPGYIILNFERGHSVRFVLENTPYSLTADQVDVLVQDGMVRVQSLEQNEYLFMYCVHCHALFMSKRNRDKIGLLYSPYDLFPLCPHCDALNWCPADDVREIRKRESEERRERVAWERLDIWREQQRQEEMARAREEATRREEERRKEARQLKTRERQKIIKRSVPGIALVLVLVLFLGVILFLGSMKPPSITNLQLANAGIMTDGTIEVSFDYQPGSMQGYIEVQFSNEGEVVDTQKLDTKNMTSGSQTVSSTAFSGISTGGGTVSFFWCPNYDCTQGQSMGSLEFTISPVYSSPTIQGLGQ